jgi:CRISPR-associated protein Cpf1
MFDQFTNLYELSKTLRFELKPVGDTQRMLEDNNVFQTHELIQKKYQKTKVYFDLLHRDFVKEALQNIKLLDLDKYNEALKNVKKITRETSAKEKKTLENILAKEEKRLRKEVVSSFDATANTWATEKYSGLKNKNLKILDEEAVFKKILLEKYGKNEDGSLNENTLEKVEIVDKKTGEIKTIEESIFEGWKGFTGYFTKFFETRKNFYKDDGTSTALATRIIDQNLKRFCDNLEVFNKIKNKVDFSEVENNFKKPWSEIFSFGFYNQCVLFL